MNSNATLTPDATCIAYDSLRAVTRDRIAAALDLVPRNNHGVSLVDVGDGLRRVKDLLDALTGHLLGDDTGAIRCALTASAREEVSALLAEHYVVSGGRTKLRTSSAS